MSQTKPNTAEPPKPPRRRWQFSLATLFLLMTVACLVLSRYYPRMYASVEVQVPTMTKATTPTYQAILRADRVLAQVVVRHPEFREIVGVETVSWIRNRMEVNHVGTDVLQIRMAGRPAERKRMQKVVDAIAEVYVDFLRELAAYPANETIATLQQSYDKLKVREDQAHSSSQENAEDPTASPQPVDGDDIRRQQMMQRIASEIQRLKQIQKQSPPPPKVIRSSSGVDW